MQKSRNAWRHALGRFEEVAALEDVRIARLRPCLQHELRRSLRMLLPQRLDAIVGVLPPRYGRPPVAEDGRFLRRCPALARDGEDLPYALGQRVGLRAGPRRDR